MKNKTVFKIRCWNALVGLFVGTLTGCLFMICAPIVPFFMIYRAFAMDADTVLDTASGPWKKMKPKKRRVQFDINTFDKKDILRVENRGAFKRAHMKDGSTIDWSGEGDVPPITSQDLKP